MSCESNVREETVLVSPRRVSDDEVRRKGDEVFETREMLFQATTVEELPKDMKKLCRASRIADSAFEKDFVILLNVLHFITKKVFADHPKSANPIEMKARSASLNNSSSQDQIILSTENTKEIFKKSLKKSGKGGFGTVYIGKEAASGTKYAIKKMKHTTPYQKIDNINEVKYMKMCMGHHNIVNFKSAYEVKDECWIVMEFLEGGTLTETKRGHEFGEEEIAFVAKELLRAICHIHSLGLVHRDVKSENIMLSILGDVKLIDFGLCAETSHIKKPSMVGSPYWMPPEMLCRKKHSYPVDIWSFGISILELANKNAPNSGDKLRAMFTVATEGIKKPFEEPNRWSSNFKDFIGKCLEYDPLKRGTATELLKHPFLEQAANTRKVMRKILSEIFLQRAIGLM